MANGNNGDNDKREISQPRKPINWTPILIAGIGVGGLAILSRLFSNLGSGPTEEEWELIETVIADWHLEWEQHKAYMDTIYADGRTPTDAEVAILSQQLEAMMLKERTVQEIHEDGLDELRDLAVAIAWDLGIAAGAFVASYIAYTLLKRWKDKNNPPPNWPCPLCDYVGATKGSLSWHLQEGHGATSVGAAAAQAEFVTTSSWAQAGVAYESSLYDTVNQSWATLSTPALVFILVGIGLILAAPYLAPIEIPAMQTAILALAAV